MTDAEPRSGLGDVRDDAVHGSFCPKMCNFACPVAAATGREAFTPWGLHVTVAELATERRAPDTSSYAALAGCTGCHACREACLYDQDVPAQVRAARAEHDVASHPAVRATAEALSAGRSPYGRELDVRTDDRDGADLQLVAGCRDDDHLLAAALALFRSAGRTVRLVVPDGCCGRLAEDLGLRGHAEDLRSALASRLDADTPTVSTDPHCLPALRRIVGVVVQDTVAALGDLLEAGELDLSAQAEAVVTYHDPCVTVRDEGTLDPPRRLLEAAGITVREPRRHGRWTACSGGGMGMDLIDADAASAVATRRAEELGEGPVVTACSRARHTLGAAGADVQDLHEVLAARLVGEGRP